MSTRSRSMFEAAFEEYKVTRQTSTGNGALYCADVTLSKEPSVPGGFIRGELGYDGPVGSRLYSMIPQAALETRHQDADRHEGVPAPDIAPPKKGPPENKWQRKARLEALKTRAMVKMLMSRRAA